MSTDDLRKELCDVKEELVAIEIQLHELIERQESVNKRKTTITKLLNAAVSNKPSTASANSNPSNCKYENTGFAWSKELDQKRSSVFHLASYRPLQLKTMNTTLDGQDCILIMPTGGGKSLCFQLTALVSKGITLVVSPLVSLMEDQLMALQRLGINAQILSASVEKDKLRLVQNEMRNRNSRLKIVYVTPEKLAKSKRFMTDLGKMYELGIFARLVIDEVHCCSQWGHDFRPDYKFLGIMRNLYPGVPILGLTATATTDVLNDVKKILNIQKCITYKASFNRPNLYYEVLPKPGTHKECMETIASLILRRFNGKSGIVYCFSRKDCEDVTTDLAVHGIKTGCYHASLHARERSRVHEKWVNDEIKVVVATIAFGMGIDKPDVRFVIHHSLSKSIENFYQESGRAGRDDQESHCILLFRFTDIFKLGALVFTDQTGLQHLHDMLRYAIDLKRCRRSLIARHFNEAWDAVQCNEMCDYCDANNTKHGSCIDKDVTDMCRDVIKVLSIARSKKQRLTGLQLIDAWYGRGKHAVPGLKSPAGKVDGERIVLEMLLEGYLKEDFHFTPYATVSYLIPGPRANLMGYDKKITMAFASKKALAAPIATTCISASTPSMSSASALYGQNSRFTSNASSKALTTFAYTPASTPVLAAANKPNFLSKPLAKTSTTLVDTPTSTTAVIGKKPMFLLKKSSTECNVSSTSKSKYTFHKKRKPLIDFDLTTSDDEENGLDFGEDNDMRRVKRVKKDAQGQGQGQGNSQDLANNSEFDDDDDFIELINTIDC